MANPDNDEISVGGDALATATEAEVREFERHTQDENKPNADTQHDDDEDGDRVARGATESDEELDAATSDAEREAIRSRRREERQRRKQNNRDRVDALLRRQASLERQNHEMAEQIKRLTQNDASAQLAQLDNAIQEAAQVHENAKAAHAAAVARADGAAASRAMDVLLAARDRHTQLTGVRQQITAPRPAQEASPIDPQVRNAAVKFARTNKWYKGPGSTDPDSQVLTLLDNAVAREGFDPRTDEYWEELEARAATYLPHRFGNGRTQQAQQEETGYNAHNRERPRSPVAGTGQRSNTVSNGGEGEFKLSAARVSAMKEAGIWDDPERRKNMIAEYRRIDGQNR